MKRIFFVIISFVIVLNFSFKYKVAGADRNPVDEYDAPADYKMLNFLTTMRVTNFMWGWGFPSKPSDWECSRNLSVNLSVHFYMLDRDEKTFFIKVIYSNSVKLYSEIMVGEVVKIIKKSEEGYMGEKIEQESTHVFTEQVDNKILILRTYFEEKGIQGNEKACFFRTTFSEK